MMEEDMEELEGLGTVVPEALDDGIYKVRGPGDGRREKELRQGVPVGGGKNKVRDGSSGCLLWRCCAGIGSGG
ncbi:hypothetical protein SLEP1_g54454 [Rubroshorea leprosula]|uniref:Uncharacterized protein n=1 Tax=Rubroshorea leprosula TaxID=152421 RepID=A0AAV5MCF1_9ROSI|nr:hypothetical protein SLEP1_g54454 [Rubroshorea leprosula]